MDSTLPIKRIYKLVLEKKIPIRSSIVAQFDGLTWVKIEAKPRDEWKMAMVLKPIILEDATSSISRALWE